ncbi:MAG: glutathione S-transferase [Gammaproteobacteria bacterium]|nr:glutathione S-transferase [Gammaproteobacteria bacterium]
MKLYILPGACSMAADIALREAGIKFELVKVDRRTRKTPDGVDFSEVNSKGYVPALRLDSGEVLTEGVAVLQYIADLNPASKLAPPAGTMERYRLQEWLSFINSEIHKAFTPLFAPNASEDMKEYARANLTKRLGWSATALGSKPFLMGEQFTVADAYFFVVLGWSAHVNFDLGPWPVLQSYQERIGARPHTVEALVAEGLKK